MSSDANKWYAIRVRSRCEKLAATDLTNRGYEVFAAVIPQRRVWADRVRIIEAPLFPGYIFGKFSPAARTAVESVPGVATVVRFGKSDAPIDAREMESIRHLAKSGLEVKRSPFLRVGSRVRVHSGPLKGTQGLLVEVKNHYQLVVSVTILQRSVSVEIDEVMVEPLREPNDMPAVKAAGAAAGQV